MDTIALWIGYTVIGMATGTFIVGGFLMITDFFARRMRSRLNAAQDLYLIKLTKLNKRIKSEPTIPQPQPDRCR